MYNNASKKICVITGSRAEYGLLRWLMEGIKKSDNLHLQVIVTGMHLSPEFGLTYKDIENDGFEINKKVEMLLSGDSLSAITKSTGLGMIGFADALADLEPDIVIILGDRYEILAAAFAALTSLIPIAHISGGERTEGSFDDAIRHSITKMSWWHFVATEEYKKRVIQLGENPNRVFNVGGLGVDTIKRTKLLNKKDLVKKTGIKFGKKNLLVTYHPTTLEHNSSRTRIQTLLDVLCDIKEIYLIFTMPNSDTGGRIIGKMIEKFVSKNMDRSILFTSMGYLNYLSTLQFVDGLIGNSSSGLAEAPTFNIATINIGDRQNGRIKAESVIDCKATKASIRKAIIKAYSKDFQKTILSVKNPYGKGEASDKILNFLKKSNLPKEPKKEFYDL